MASSKSSRNDIVGFCAFAAVIIAGVVGLLQLLNSKLGWGIDFSFFLLIKDLLLILAVFLAGWFYVSRSNFKNKTLWIVLFIVFVVLAVVGVIPL